MADSPSQSATWFEALKAVTKSTGRNSIDRTADSKSPSPVRHSNARRGSPVHANVEAAAGKVKTTKSEGGSSPDYADSSFSFSRSIFPLAQARNSPDSRAKNNGTAAWPKKDKSPPPQHPAKPSTPPLALPLPPAISSPLSSKSLQYLVGKDFLYEPSTKFDLGPEPRPRRSRRCCYCFLAIILLLLMVIGILVGVMTVKLKPRQPSLSIGDDLRVTSLNFSEPVGHVPQLEMGLNFSLTLSNPNKHAKVLYTQISAIIYYNNTLALGTVDIPGFTQGNSGTKLLTSGNAEKITSVPADTVVGLRGEVTASNVQINLRGSAGGKFQILWFKVKPFSLPIDCQLNVKPGAVGQEAQILNNTCYK